MKQIKIFEQPTHFLLNEEVNAWLKNNTVEHVQGELKVADGKYLYVLMYDTVEPGLREVDKCIGKEVDYNTNWLNEVFCGYGEKDKNATLNVIHEIDEDILGRYSDDEIAHAEEVIRQVDESFKKYK